MPPTGSPAQPSAAEAGCSDDMPSTVVYRPPRRPLPEIGRIPRRDRSSSGSRSVHFRLEIGRVPRRDWLRPMQAAARARLQDATSEMQAGCGGARPPERRSEAVPVLCEAGEVLAHGGDESRVSPASRGRPGRGHAAREHPGIAIVVAQDRRTIREPVVAPGALTAGRRCQLLPERRCMILVDSHQQYHSRGPNTARNAMTRV